MYQRNRRNYIWNKIMDDYLGENMNIGNLIGEATEYDKKLSLEAKKPKSWCCGRGSPPEPGFRSSRHRPGCAGLPG